MRQRATAGRKQLLAEWTDLPDRRLALRQRPHLSQDGAWTSETVCPPVQACPQDVPAQGEACTVDNPVIGRNCQYDSGCGNVRSDLHR